MATPSAAEAAQPGSDEAALDERAWSRSLVVVGASCFALATLLPVGHLVKGLVIGFSCLAAVALASPLVRKIWRPLATARSVFFLAAGATAFGRFVVPHLHSDSELVRVGAYLIFLALFVGVLVLGSRVQGMGKPLEQQREYAFWPRLLLSVAYTAVVLAALYLLARFFSATITLLFLGADVLVALAVHRARKALRAEAPADRCLSWTVAELIAKHPVLPTLSVFLAVLGVFAYPITVGVIYFSSDVPSDSLTTWVFRLTIISLFFVGLPLVVFYAVGMLASPNVDEKTRIRQLATTSAGLVNVGIYLSLFLWSSGWGNTQNQVDASSSVLAFSPVVAGSLLAYFFLVVLIPYAVGTTRSLRQERRFLNAQELLLSELIVALERPDQRPLGGGLRRWRRELKEVERESMRENAVLSLAEKGSQLDPKVRARLPKLVAAKGLSDNAKSAYRRTRTDQRKRRIAEDPRLRFWKQLKGIGHYADDFGFMLAAAPGHGAEVRLDWTEFLRRRRDDIDRYTASRPRTRFPAWLTIGGVIAPILSVVLDQFGNWIWSQIADSFPG